MRQGGERRRRQGGPSYDPSCRCTYEDDEARRREEEQARELEARLREVQAKQEAIKREREKQKQEEEQKRKEQQKILGKGRTKLSFSLGGGLR
ncbi:hypothetical protein DUNSADRAFT_5263 [Dunaliella salina]|uniref:Uncharacterized protein n=1 Tax=Dunaliella salina TaxID=3046 RepID=A0ABQ7FUF2_DUNSA|nr:hypothetical protein DUNSADRAFT_5263 [Dunaliella salina]|eukprot:KAF5826041.1 hypothetical protein DUNSADRAFT_5263 [Dunaliella salina]